MAMNRMKTRLGRQLRESLASVLPIVGIVLVLCALLVPMRSGVLLMFLAGSVLLIMGMMLFTLGSEMSISPMGEYVGAYMTRSKKLWLVLGLSFVLGFIITISEPDLQVLAGQVPTVPNAVLILSVAAGVGVFLVLALARMLFRIPLSVMLWLFYGIVFLLTALVPDSFLSIAFDSGGVTTGPMTVPFIMSLGVGVSAIRNDRNAASDSFGLVAMCSIGPVLSVLVLGVIYPMDAMETAAEAVTDAADSVEVFRCFVRGLPTYAREIGVSLLPIVAFLLLFQLAVLRLPRQRLKRIGIGLVYTYVGLVLFLTGANVGFMPAGKLLGELLGEGSLRFLVVPLGMLMGYFIVRAEPAVYVLNRQVEEMTDGNISAGAMGTALSIGVAVSIGLAMARVLTGVSILYFVLPGYALALLLSFLVPRMYTAIAFDSGGVASGPMTAAFLVPLAQGVCLAVGGNLVEDAFGVVAMVAMTPLITIQLMGLYAEARRRQRSRQLKLLAEEYRQMDDDAIILL